MATYEAVGERTGTTDLRRARCPAISSTDPLAKQEQLVGPMFESMIFPGEC